MSDNDTALRDALLADPQPMLDAMSGADHTRFRSQLHDAVDYALSHYNGVRAPSGLQFDADAWRTADRVELAEHLAVYLGCRLVSLIEQGQMETFRQALGMVRQQVLDEAPDRDHGQQGRERP